MISRRASKTDFAGRLFRDIEAPPHRQTADTAAGAAHARCADGYLRPAQIRLSASAICALRKYAYAGRLLRRWRQYAAQIDGWARLHSPLCRILTFIHKSNIF